MANFQLPQQKRNIKKYDQPIVGFVLGTIIYIIAILLIYYYRNKYSASGEHFLKVFTSVGNIYFMNEASKLLSLSMIGLLAPFYFLINKYRYVAARGVIVVALLCAVLILLYNFVWQ
jgi:ABC-type xylose transport system permease subunit